METKWYYAENNRVIGPISAEEITDRIRLAKDQPHFVWTEGMSEWTEAKFVPEFSSEFQRPTPASKESRTGTEAASATMRAALAQRARKELIEYVAVSAYLWVCFGALIFYKATILRSEGIEFTPFGLAIVKALILGKFVMVLQALKIGERRKPGGVVLSKIFTKSLLFTILLIFLTVIEELAVGRFHGRTSREVLSEIAGGTLPQAFAIGVLIFLILIPYFAYREIATVLGEGELPKLLTGRRSPEKEE